MDETFEKWTQFLSIPAYGRRINSPERSEQTVSTRPASESGEIEPLNRSTEPVIK